MVVVRGHRLHEQGAAYGARGCPETNCVVSGNGRLQGKAREGGGHARCECGESSEHLQSSRERREWHRKHKMMLVDMARLEES